MSKARYLFAISSLAVLAGCSTGPPPPLGERALAEAQTFPYFPLYWVGPSFRGQALTAVDGRKSYNSAIGDGVYYGDCVLGAGTLPGGSGCRLPLQVSTVIYHLHSNSPLGPQSNALIRGVPAAIYDGGRSVELYSGRLAIDVYSSSPGGALAAARALRPINAPGSPDEPLPEPRFCPGLSGRLPRPLRKAMADLPGHPCQALAAAEARIKALQRRGLGS
ncbi:MAG TPA: hypothetical protein VGX16_07340 [Solirubrobacteraceae bacterium]|nr:hypothetical protein [Solirubrobacteraceae bacterium]